MRLSFGGLLVLSSFACNTSVLLDGEADGDCGELPAIDGCVSACGGLHSNFECVDGTWQCPDVTERDDCGCDPMAFEAMCPHPCGDAYAATCMDDQWECIPARMNPPVCEIEPPFDRARWSHSFGSMGLEEASRVLVDAAANVYVAGHFRDTLYFDDGATFPSGGGYDAVVVKYDYRGVRQWVKQFGEAGDDLIQGLALRPDRDVVLLMSSSATTDPGGQPGPARLVQLAAETGEIAEQTTLGVALDGGRETRLAVQSETGDIVIAGSAEGPVSVAGAPSLDAPGEAADLYVMRFDAYLNPMWGRRFGGDGIDELRSVDVDDQGRVFVAGVYDSSVLAFDDTELTHTSNGDGFVAALASGSGQTLWARRLSSSARASLDDVTAHGDGGAVVTGSVDGEAQLASSSIPTSNDTHRAMIGFFDGSGVLLFVDTLGPIVEAPSAIPWRVESTVFRSIYAVGGVRDASGDVALRIDHRGSDGEQIWTFDLGTAEPIDISFNGEMLAIAGQFETTLDLGQGPLVAFEEGTGFVGLFAVEPRIP